MCRFSANWTSVRRSPTIAERAQSMLRSCRYGSIRPMPGLRVGALSAGQLQSISTSRKAMPWLAKICSIRSLGPSNAACGKASLPSPSWLVTMTNW